eukprot:2528545-Alexandrium_andersonii.AAC.1
MAFGPGRHWQVSGLTLSAQPPGSLGGSHVSSYGRADARARLAPPCACCSGHLSLIHISEPTRLALI